MALQFGGSGNLTLKLNANPRTGVPMPKFGQSERTAIPAGSLPKRGRGGGGGNPLARIPKEVLDVFQALAAPKLVFQTVRQADGTGGERVTPIDEHGETLAARIQDGEVGFFNVRNEKVDEVLFKTEDDETYTAEGVEPIEDMDRVPVSGDVDTINKLYQAMQRFNKATGKQLRMLLDHNKLDDKGNIIEQVKVIWRTA